MMNGNWQKDYPLLPESLKESDIENNSSLKKMINFCIKISQDGIEFILEKSNSTNGPSITL